MSAALHFPQDPFAIRPFPQPRNNTDKPYSEVVGAGTGNQVRRRALLMAFLRSGSTRTSFYEAAVRRISSTRSDFFKNKWQPLQFMLQKYGKAELQQRVQSGSIAVKRNPKDDQFFLFSDEVHGSSLVQTEDSSYTASAQTTSDRAAFLKTIRGDGLQMKLDLEAAACGDGEDLGAQGLEADLSAALGFKGAAKKVAKDPFGEELEVASQVEPNVDEKVMKKKLRELARLGAALKSRVFEQDTPDKRLLKSVVDANATVESMLLTSTKPTPKAKSALVQAAQIFKKAHAALQQA